MGIAYSNFSSSENSQPTKPTPLLPVIASIGLPEQGYRDYLAGEGSADYEHAQEEAVVDQVFGVPMFYFENEPFWGYDRMGLLEHRLIEAGLRRAEPMRQAG